MSYPAILPSRYGREKKCMLLAFDSTAMNSMFRSVSPDHNCSAWYCFFSEIDGYDVNFLLDVIRPPFLL